MSEPKHSPGPWGIYRMTKAGEPMTPEDIGEYVKNSVLKSAEQSGTMDFLFVSVDGPDGSSDICHVGNGPRGPHNAALIARAPDLLAEVEKLRKMLRVAWDYDWEPRHVMDANWWKAREAASDEARAYLDALDAKDAN